MTWLSVIIPCRNGERFLSDALQSLANQRDHGIEVIFVDGSTNDESLKIIQKFYNRLNILSFSRPELDSWMEKSNFGVEQAQSEYVCILHVDDTWLHGRCSFVRNWLLSYPHAVMHLHPCYFIDEVGDSLGEWRCPLPDDGNPIDPHMFKERLIVQNFIGRPSPVILRETYLKVGGLDEDLCYTADWDLWMKIASEGNVFYHNEPLAGFRIHREALTISTSKDSENFKRQHEIVVDRYINEIKLLYRARIYRMAIASLEMNVALAMALTGKFKGLFQVLCMLLTLGPGDLYRYFKYSRIADRLIPRIRACAAGRL